MSMIFINFKVGSRTRYFFISSYKVEITATVSSPPTPTQLIKTHNFPQTTSPISWWPIVT